MISSSAADKADQPTWQYVQLADYQLPTTPVTYSARVRFASFRRLFQRDMPSQSLPLKAQEKLSSLPECLLETIAPIPDWRDSASALNTAMSDWLDKDVHRAPVMVIVGAPYSGNSEALQALAKMQSWRTLDSPAPEQILTGDSGWLSSQVTGAGPWVLPNLEKVYLRHAEGLQLVRQFIAHACSGNMGKVIIGCDSWAWAFIQHLWSGPTPAVMTLQAFDEPRLIKYFQGLINASTGGRLLIRLSDDGRYVLPLPEKHDTGVEYSNFLQIVAAYSRGNFGITRKIWCSSMQTEPGENQQEHLGTEQADMSQQTIWIIPWNQLKLPSLPSDIGCNEAFILHALLLHSGLTQEVLQRLLPLPQKSVLATLYRLKEYELVERDNADWQVTPLGYPAVRQFLQSSRYLVDQF
ncbi:hypothetical protein [Desulfogranum marinum]|uniref:hypothetical protein n=1 Tax=Desulfogranum marinum TaxID=453220 RepID=UPI0019655F44|nr:hypothetical protein [Desulfogranum marinum]MBM9511260.1 hypothetical protein [Desulfogranum marinum]